MLQHNNFTQSVYLFRLRITDEARQHLRDALEAKNKELDTAVREAEVKNNGACSQAGATSMMSGEEIPVIEGSCRIAK